MAGEKDKNGQGENQEDPKLVGGSGSPLDNSFGDLARLLNESGFTLAEETPTPTDQLEPEGLELSEEDDPSSPEDAFLAQVEGLLRRPDHLPTPHRSPNSIYPDLSPAQRQIVDRVGTRTAEFDGLTLRQQLEAVATNDPKYVLIPGAKARAIRHALSARRLPKGVRVLSTKEKNKPYGHFNTYEIFVQFTDSEGQTHMIVDDRDTIARSFAIDRKIHVHDFDEELDAMIDSKAERKSLVLLPPTQALKLVYLAKALADIDSVQFPGSTPEATTSDEIFIQASHAKLAQDQAMLESARQNLLVAYLKIGEGFEQSHTDFGYTFSVSMAKNVFEISFHPPLLALSREKWAERALQRMNDDTTLEDDLPYSRSSKPFVIRFDVDLSARILAGHGEARKNNILTALYKRLKDQKKPPHRSR